MTVHELRLVLLQALIAKHGGAAAFSRRTGIAESTLSRVAGSNPTEVIGGRLAARIEAALGLPADHLSDFSTLLDDGRKLDAALVIGLCPTQKLLLSALLSRQLSPADARLLLVMLRRLP